jgi:cellulase/cellobiase CelA1
VRGVLIAQSFAVALFVLPGCRAVDSVELTAFTSETEESVLNPPPVDACGLVVVSHSADLEALAQTRSTWESGACVDIEVTNSGNQAQIWHFTASIGGTFSDAWNSLAMPLGEGLVRFEGDPETDNVAILPGESTGIGMCMVCEPATGDSTSTSATR